MVKKQLGRTGLYVTQLGFGSSGDRSACPKTWGVRRVVSDEVFADLISQFGARFRYQFHRHGTGLWNYRATDQSIQIKPRRSEFFLATKCGCCPIQHEDHLEVKTSLEEKMSSFAISNPA